MLSNGTSRSSEPAMGRQIYFGPAAVDEVIVEGCGSLERFELSTSGNIGRNVLSKVGAFLALPTSFVFFWGTILTDQFRSTVSLQTNGPSIGTKALGNKSFSFPATRTK